MRPLAAAEGDSDALVIGGLLEEVWPGHVVDWKRFIARGFPVVRREVPVLVRAAHYGLYDALVVHFDLDDTAPSGWTTVRESPRWIALQRDVEAARSSLRSLHRMDLRVAFLTPVQSTEAWLGWAREDENGRGWERRPRHELKSYLFGAARRGVRGAVKETVPRLVDRMRTEVAWPLSLREAVCSLEGILGKADRLTSAPP